VSALSDVSGWGWVARLLHWATAALVAVQFGIALRIATTDDLVRRFETAQVLKSWGAAILAFVVLRLVWRLVDRQHPAMPPETPVWQARAARVSHALLYVALVAVPVAGWVSASASPLQTLMQVDNEVFGVLVLPDPWPEGSDTVADAAHAIHVIAALALLALVAVHVAEALGHHFVRRDDILRRMVWR
jgi:cytochrome b561